MLSDTYASISQTGDDDVLTFSGNKVNGSSYSIDGNKIILPWYEEEQWWMKVSFSGSTMTLYCDTEVEGIPMKMWATYAKSGSRNSVSKLAVKGNHTTLMSRILEITRK